MRYPWYPSIRFLGPSMFLRPSLVQRITSLSRFTQSRAMVTVADVENKLMEKLAASDVTVRDTSGGCGASFEVAVVSSQFEGKRLLERHRLINSALENELKTIHALSIRQCWTPEQQKKAQGV